MWKRNNVTTDATQAAAATITDEVLNTSENNTDWGNTNTWENAQWTTDATQVAKTEAAIPEAPKAAAQAPAPKTAAPKAAAKSKDLKTFEVLVPFNHGGKEFQVGSTIEADNINIFGPNWVKEI